MNDQTDQESVQFFAVEEGVPMRPSDGVEMRGVFGAGGSMNVVKMAPGAEVPVHTHPHEQIGLVLDGVQILIVGGVEYPLGPMQAYVVPGGVEHGGIAGPEGCTVLDMFVPTREDLRPSAVTAYATA